MKKTSFIRTKTLDPQFAHTMPFCATPLTQREELAVRKSAERWANHCSIEIRDTNLQEGYLHSMRMAYLSQKAGVNRDYQLACEHANQLLEIAGIKNLKSDLAGDGVVIEPTTYMEIGQVRNGATVFDDKCNWECCRLHDMPREDELPISAVQALRLAQLTHRIDRHDVWYLRPHESDSPPTNKEIATRSSQVALTETLKVIPPVTRLLKNSFFISLLAMGATVTAMATVVANIDPILVARLDTPFQEKGRSALYFSIARWV